MRGAVDKELADSDAASRGFCLLNNVAIGAAYALNVHRHSISRVAIIDFDVHHGNGTEALVRGLAGPQTKVLPIFGGSVTGYLEQHSFCPWLDMGTDKDSVFFGSVHRFDGKFYPYSGMTGVDGNVVNVGLTSGASGEDLRDAFMRVILPRLTTFNPDMIFISAGFDGHKRDRLAAGQCDFDEHDFYWMTEQLLAVARECGHGRVVSVLEGGYNTRVGWLSPLSQSVTAHIRALMGSHATKSQAMKAEVAAVDMVMMDEGTNFAKKRKLEEAELFGESSETSH
jgi:acetoin utilization deacetylase AcuC-like enzyme